MLLGAVALAPLALDGEHIELDDAMRDELTQDGHRFAKAGAGSIHYELAGPADGELVVLVHGVSGPLEVFDAIVEPLHRAGFRTLRYDHYGRGWSDRVEADYDLDLFVGGLEDLLAAIEHDGSVRLVGSSMGAIVSSEFALRHGERVAALALLGPAGFPIEATFLARFIRVPLVGDYLMKTFGDRSLAAHNRKYFVDPDPFDALQARFEEQLEVVGTKAAVLSTMRHTPVQSYVDGYARLGETDTPVLIAWGDGDTVFPVSYADQARDALPEAELFVVEDAGHLPMLEQPAAVLERLLPFLAAPQAPP